VRRCGTSRLNGILTTAGQPTTIVVHHRCITARRLAVPEETAFAREPHCYAENGDQVTSSAKNPA
jgi:hypothetical protein